MFRGSWSFNVSCAKVAEKPPRESALILCLEMVLDGLIIFLALLGGRNRRVLAHERFVPLPEWRGRGQIWRPAQVGLFAGATPKPRTVCSQLYRSRSLQLLEWILLCHHVLRSTRFTNVCTTENWISSTWLHWCTHEFLTTAPFFETFVWHCFLKLNDVWWHFDVMKWFSEKVHEISLLSRAMWITVTTSQGRWASQAAYTIKFKNDTIKERAHVINKQEHDLQDKSMHSAKALQEYYRGRVQARPRRERARNRNRK